MPGTRRSCRRSGNYYEDHNPRIVGFAACRAEAEGTVAPVVVEEVRPGPAASAGACAANRSRTIYAAAIAASVVKEIRHSATKGGGTSMEGEDGG